MNTFTFHFAHFPAFISQILAWHPDYLVPVAKKGCKLIKTIELRAPGLKADEVLRYRAFFDGGGALVSGKKVAVIDDATQRTSTLASYRKYFEKKGAIVRTFSFVGHDELRTGERPKQDHQAEIGRFLAGPVYNEYIIQQSFHLLNSGCHFDLDHIVFEAHLAPAAYADLIDRLSEMGTVLFVLPSAVESPIERFSLHYPAFFGRVPFFSSDKVSLGSLIKLKFAYNRQDSKLSFSPLVFPEWQYRATKSSAELITNPPFQLPYVITDRLDHKDRTFRHQVYTNLSFVAAVSLAKAFLQELGASSPIGKKIQLVRNDLTALLGHAAASRLVQSTSQYLTHGHIGEFQGRSLRRTPRSPPRRFTNFAKVHDYLRSGYRKLEARHKHHGSYHFYISYRELFRGYHDRLELSEKLDYFCDLGTIVPEILYGKSIVQRGCRTGEADSDPSWIRTDALLGIVAMVANQATKEKGVEPTLYNKILANFAFDYPRQRYTELHCLDAVPYFFGSFMKVSHPLRAPIPQNLYEFGRNAEFVEWNARQKVFRPKNEKRLVQEITVLFHQQQQAGYTEILNYLKLLADIARRKDAVDVMNLLSICRDQDVFYAHVSFNLRQSYADFLAYFSVSPDRMSSALGSARDNAESGITKCRLAEETHRTIDELARHYSTNLDFAHAVAKLRENHSPFDNASKDLVLECRSIARLELLLCTMALWHLEQRPEHVEKLRALGIDDELARQGRKENRVDLLQSVDARRELLDGLSEHVASRLTALPRIKETYRSRWMNAARKSAENRAAHFVREHHYPEGVFLAIDFTGFREIADPVADTLGPFYELVKGAGTERGGRILYGGDGGDDAFMYFFRDIDPALRCVEDIKEGFTNNVFLNIAPFDVKFGLAWGDFAGSNPEKTVTATWGVAKDCCELKAPAYVNRGDLLLPSQTYQIIAQKMGEARAAQFVELRGAKHRSGQPLFSYSRISPLRP